MFGATSVKPLIILLLFFADRNIVDGLSTPTKCTTAGPVCWLISSFGVRAVWRFTPLPLPPSPKSHA